MTGYHKHFQSLFWAILKIVLMGPRISDANHGTLKYMHIALLLILLGPTLQIVQLQYWILGA